MSTRTTSSDPDPRRELVQRVAGSVSFHKTWRLRELFLFLAERALSDPDHPVREQEIGDAVFGRGQDFDPGLDPLVRVQTSQLRKRLHQYFTTEGAAEPVVIEIPKGAYVPAFRERALAPLPEPEPEPDDDVAAGRAPVRRLAAACVLLLAACGFLLHQNDALRRARPASGAPRPTVERLWRQMLVDGQTTYVIAADASLAVFLDTTKRVLSPSEYQRKRFQARYGADPLASDDPADVRFARQLLERPLTSLVDAELAFRVGDLARTLGATSQLLSAREATADHFKASAVLSGPRRANPWIELVEDRMNFRMEYDHPADTVGFANLAPSAGEPAAYRATDRQTGYCRVALTRNLDGSGWLLLLTGTDMAATRAGVEQVTDEAALADLARALGVEKGGPFPAFEAVLQARFVGDAPLTFERLAHRAHRPGP